MHLRGLMNSWNVVRSTLDWLYGCVDRCVFVAYQWTVLGSFLVSLFFFLQFQLWGDCCNTLLTLLDVSLSFPILSLVSGLHHFLPLSLSSVLSSGFCLLLIRRVSLLMYLQILVAVMDVWFIILTRCSFCLDIEGIYCCCRCWSSILDGSI